MALQLGFRYGGAYTDVSNLSDFHPELRVGARLPHVWIEMGGRRRSSLDLVDDGDFMLFVAPQYGRGLSIGPTNAPIKVVADESDLMDRFSSLSDGFDFRRGGGVLVRPDGHVAAIFTQADPQNLSREVARALEQALAEGLAP